MAANKPDRSPHQDYVFTKRPGTSEGTAGYDYEKGILTRIMQQCSRLGVSDYYLATNIDDAGAFDDAVLRYDFIDPLGASNSNVVFLQAKLKGKSAIKMENLFAKPNDTKTDRNFSLLKYFESYKMIMQKIRDKNEQPIFVCEYNEIEFIIYTNTSFATNAECLLIEAHSDITEQILQSNTKCIERLSKGTRTGNVGTAQSVCCYRVVLDELQMKKLGVPPKDTVQFREFLNHLKFYTKQSNSNELDELVETDFQDDISCNASESKVRYRELKDYVNSWWCAKQRVEYQSRHNNIYNNSLFCAREQKVQKMSTSNLSIFGAQLQVDPRTLQDFANGITANRLIKLENGANNAQNISHVVLKQLENLKTSDNTMTIKPIFFNSSQCIENRDLLANSYNTKNVHEVLVVVSTESDPTESDELVNSISSLLGDTNSTSSIKTVVFQKADAILLKIFQDKGRQELQALPIPGLSRETNLFNLQVLTEISKTKLGNTNVKLQGKQCKLSSVHPLDTLMHVDIVNAILSNSSITLGKPVSGLGSLHEYYMDRRFYRKVLLSTKMLNDSNIYDDNIFVVISSDESVNIVLEKAQQNLPSNTNFSNLHVTSDTVQGKSTFDNLCHVMKNVNIHLFLKVDREKLQWFQTNGSKIALKKFMLPACESPSDLVSESEFIDASNKQKFMLIADTAGMGKSTVLKSLAKNLHHQTPNTWIVELDLNSFRKKLYKLSRLNAAIDENSLIDFLAKAVLGLKNDFEKNIFKNSCTSTGLVALLIDGFDEVLPQFEETLGYLIKAAENTKISRIFITTRPVQNDKLQALTNEFAFQLLPFSETNQVEFLTKYWHKALIQSCTEATEVNGNRELTKKLSKEFVSTLTALLPGKSVQCIGIPLLTKMVADIFEKEYISALQENKDKIKVSFQELNIFKLYNLFWDRKINIYMQQKLNCKTYVLDYERRMRDDGRLMCNKLMLLAANELLSDDVLKVFLTPEEWETLQSTKTTELKDVERYGIISVTNDNSVQFIHRSFAEYFFARYINSYIVKYELRDNMNRFVIRELLLQPHFQNCRMFLEAVFTDGIFKHWTTVLMNIWEGTDITYLHSNNSFLHVAALENSCNLFKVISVSLKSDPTKYAVIANAKDLNGKSTAHIAAEINDIEILNHILTLNMNVNEKDDNGNTPLHYAAASGCLSNFTLLLDRGADIALTNQDGQSVLHFAARFGCLKIVQFILENKLLSVNCTSTKKSPSLHVAASNGHMNVVSYLITKGADIDFVDNMGYSALHKSAFSGHSEIAGFLVERNATLGHVTKHGLTVLHSAVRGGCLDIVKMILNSGKIDIDAADCRMSTPVHEAVKHQQIQIVQWLIEKGASVNKRNKQGRTVLHVAASCGNLQVFKLCLDKGADVTLVDNEKNTVAQIAVNNSNLNIVEFLTAKYNEQGMTGKLLSKLKIQDVVVSGDIEIMKHLADEGASITETDKAGMTLAHRAAAAGNLTLLRFVNEKECNIFQCNLKQETVLHVASENGRLEIVKYLFQQLDYELESKCVKGQTALQKAVLNGHIDVAKYLITSGSDTQESDLEWNSILHHAVTSGNLEQVILVLSESNVNLRNKKGKTALHIAANLGHNAIVRCLLNKRCAMLPCMNRETPLHEAVKTNHFTTIQLLLEFDKTLIDYPNLEGFTLLSIASVSGNVEIFNYLLTSGANTSYFTYNKGESILHLAARHGRLDIVKIERQKSNFPIDFGTHIWITPLMLATRNGHRHVVDFLLKQGADLFAIDYYGNTILHYAARSGNLELFEFLSSKISRDKWDTNYLCKSLLHEAARSGSIKIVEFLIYHQFDIHEQCCKGRMAIHEAASEGHLMVVKLLVKREADLEHKDVNEKTPLDLAIDSNRGSVIEFLKRYERN